MKKKKFLKLITLFIVLIGIALGIYAISQEAGVFDIRDEASSGFNLDTYQGMARFGNGRLTEAFVDEANYPEYDDLKFGWYHNWGYRYDFFGDSDLNSILPTDIPQSLDFYPLIGGYGPNEANCHQQLKNYFKKLDDSTVVWVGNELGWDDQRDPHTYAEQYKGWYECVKSVNPNLKVAPGANPGNVLMDYRDYRIEQWVHSDDPTGGNRWSVNNPIDYIQYITYAKDDYRDLYGEEMPIDAYVIHAYHFDCDSVHDVDCIKNTIIEFRKFMKQNGEQKLHLYIKEMGILDREETDTVANGQTMHNLYDMLLNSKDSSIGNPNDNNRLVQRWAWFWTAVPCIENSAGELNCDLYNTAFYKCMAFPDKTYTADCRDMREPTSLVDYHKQYVNQIWDSYDATPPKKPSIRYSHNGNNTTIQFSASDNGKINNYEISVGTQQGKTDVMLWKSTDTKKSYTLSNVIGKWVNIKAIDDGYNWSPIASVKIEQHPAYDVYPIGNPDGVINQFDLGVVNNNFKWKREPRVDAADIDRDGDVDVLDLSAVINNWTKKN